MGAKKVFISYSHDSDEHRDRVLALSERLRADGIETTLDQYLNGSPLQGWPRWMMDQVDAADSILVVCTEPYYRRFRGHEEPGKGRGGDWEGALITQEIYDVRSRTSNFVPVFLSDPVEAWIPEPLRSVNYYALTSEVGYQSLYDFLLEQGGVEPQPVGSLKTRARRKGKALTFGESPPAEGADEVIPPQEFIDDKVRLAATRLNQARAAKALTLPMLVGVLGGLFERGTFRREPSVGLCATQEWDFRLHAALQTLRFMEEYEPFVEAEAPAFLQRYRELAAEVSRYCQRMAAYLFDPSVGVSELRRLIGTDEFISRVKPKRKWFEGAVDPETCGKIDPHLTNAIQQMKSLSDEVLAIAESSQANTARPSQILLEEYASAPANPGPSAILSPEIVSETTNVRVQRKKRIYVSYSYDSNEHIERVREFAARLKADGIDLHIDADVDVDPPEGWPTFSQNQIQDADYVILICTETYRRRFDGREEPGRGKGVSFEGKLIRQEIFDSQSTRKFIPVILEFEDQAHIPSLVRDRSRYVVSQDAELAAELDYQALLRKLGAAPAMSVSQVSSPPKRGNLNMPTHQFNARRLHELEELLDIEYDKSHEFEKEIALSDGASRITLKQRFKREVTPHLRALEKEYAEMLVAGVPAGQIPEGEADVLVSELAEVTSTILETAPANAPQEMLRVLHEISDKLSKPEESGSAKLKLSLPLIPTIVSYEIEIETAGLMKKIWRKSRDFFKGLVTNDPR